MSALSSPPRSTRSRCRRSRTASLTTTGSSRAPTSTTWSGWVAPAPCHWLDCAEQSLDARRRKKALIVGSAFFGDGCAAAVIEHGDAGPGPAVVASAVHQIGATLGAVRMELSERDSYLHLDRDLPEVAAAGSLSLVEAFLGPLGLTPVRNRPLDRAPGGRRILERVQAALSLSDPQVSASYDVLACHGNIGTPTIFYVLEQTSSSRPYGDPQPAGSEVWWSQFARASPSG